MNVDFTDFIGVFEDVYPEGFCEHLIEEFISYKGQGAGNSRQATGEARDRKDDYQIFFNAKNICPEDFQGKDCVELFFSGLQKCFDLYSQQYSVMRLHSVRCHDMKIQETSGGGGYHIWHQEQGNGAAANRVTVYTLYLNTLKEESNGETEFLYQERRVRPKENTMILWPAAYTHPHRGNPVYGNEKKYIVTGWFYLEE